MSARPSSRQDFKVAIICALQCEYNAVTYLFDELWCEHADEHSKAPGDPNFYMFGRIGRHNIVLTMLPKIGKAAAASVATSLRHSYENLELVLLIGVCGAVTHRPGAEILLGDVIISKFVVQYDFGRL